ncbi:hemicentin-1-like isoform X2 [Pseudoliparis swirei]|uniref:hemicentin-1-like isoform X2 n=1 Tax=Pseudoliparis swirei TaxID=2059687 RepID=UPI0024BDB44E|nr:hemicentin-1-like isoform X2 [Pseudoliparis swirei]
MLVPPSIHDGEQQVVAVESAPAQLVCVADGVPQPSLTWEKDGALLSERTGEYTILPSGELVIDVTQPGDGGVYTCVATNAVGRDSRPTTLSVHTRPVFTERLADVALNKGERLLLACGVGGVPPPRITWAFNDNVVPVPSDRVPGLSELLVERVDKEDSGTYSCEAENDVGTIKSLGVVYVREPPIIDGDHHSDRVEPLGGNAILSCEVRGDPPPTIRWSKSGINIQTGDRVRQLDNGSLAIYGTASEDAGDCMCVAANEAGVVERSVALTVHSAPAITAEPTVVVDAGGTVVLDCRAEGEPTPTMEWSRKGGRRLLGDDRFSPLSNGSLRVSSAQKEDTAQYECLARNLLGSARARVTLTVRGEPDAAGVKVCVSRGPLGVVSLGPVQRVLWRRLPKEASAVDQSSPRQRGAPLRRVGHGDARLSGERVQWMLTGPSGLCGRSVLVPVVMATGRRSGPAATLRRSTGASRARARPRRSPCAAVSSQRSLEPVEQLGRLQQDVQRGSDEALPDV